MKTEVWTCAGKAEIHIFDEANCNDYVLGYNPERIAIERVCQILRVSGAGVPDDLRVKHQMVLLSLELEK